jgi:N6-L-threonylcarbamoyladenine synthase
MRIIGIETSCDDTSVACVDDEGVRSNLVSSQIDLHQHFGGVVPELASRAHHTNLLPVSEAALREAGWELRDVEAVAATAGPGLIGAVLMGLSWAKSLSYALRLPFVGVHHIEGHILANGIDRAMQLPAIVLVVSGGHTETVVVHQIGQYERIGTTRDDAAGETFDKAAKLMGLEYPGGPVIERLARTGRSGKVELPRALLAAGELDFSFSGLKTAVRRTIEALGPSPLEQELADVAHALQLAIMDSLVEKTRRAIDTQAGTGLKGLYLAGGVAANGPLRDAFAGLAAERSLDFEPPPLAYCTDNAAMIAWAGRWRLLRGGPDSLDLPAFARGGIQNWF